MCIRDSEWIFYVNRARETWPDYIFDGQEAKEIILDYGERLFCISKSCQKKNWMIWVGEHPPGIAEEYRNTREMNEIEVLLDAYATRFMTLNYQGRMMSTREIIRQARGDGLSPTGYAPVRNSMVSTLGNPAGVPYGNWSIGLSEPWTHIFARILGGVHLSLIHI